MEIKVNVVVDLSPATLSFLSSLFSGSLAAPKQETPVKKLKPAAAAPQPVDDAEQITREVAADKAATPTLAAIKAKVIALRDAGKKDKTVQLMSEYKLEKLSSLSEDKYPEFMEKLNAIK